MEAWQGLMLRADKFSVLANQAADRYVAYLESILASYNRLILDKNINVGSIKVFKDEIMMLNKHYLEREVEQTVETYNQINTFVQEDTKEQSVDVTDDEEWASYLSENTDFIFEVIKLQSTKDALYAINFFRTKLIQIVNMNDYQRAYALVFSSKDLAFFYTDKIGRKINSVKYIRTLYRDYLLKNYNDLIAGSGILNGLDEATIINIDIEHGDHEKIISINNETELNYFAIREDKFHPNSNNILRL